MPPVVENLFGRLKSSITRSFAQGNPDSDWVICNPEFGGHTLENFFGMNNGYFSRRRLQLFINNDSPVMNGSRYYGREGMDRTQYYYHTPNGNRLQPRMVPVRSELDDVFSETNVRIIAHWTGPQQHEWTYEWTDWNHLFEESAGFTT